MLGGRKTRSNKGKKRVPYGPRTGKTRSGARFRAVAVKTRKVGRKTRSNKGKKRGPYGPRTGKTRSGAKFRGGGPKVCCVNMKTKGLKQFSFKKCPDGYEKLDCKKHEKGLDTVQTGCPNVYKEKEYADTCDFL